MTSNIQCIVNIRDPKSDSPNAAIASNSSIPVCAIEFHILFRYQLKLPSNNDTVLVIEDIVTPEHRTSLRIPVIFPLSIWRELYLEDALKTLNLDASVLDFLKKQIVEAAFSLAQRNIDNNNSDKTNKGFAMLVELGIFKCDIIGREEADRIRESIKNYNVGTTKKKP